VDHANGRLDSTEWESVAEGFAAARFFSSIYDLGDGEVDFSACHKVLKSVNYRGWICVDLDTARSGPRADFERCGEYIVKKLEPIYA
jgi:L-ribulose-5-phosphate 3-epimerase UlaE